MPALAGIALLSSLGALPQPAAPSDAPGPRCEWSARWRQLTIPAFGPTARLVGPERKKGRIRVPQPRQRHEIDGRLTVQVAIDAKGRTVDAQVIERPLVIPPWPELEESVLADARKLKWKPATADGVPVPVCMDLPVLAGSPRLVE
jgi:TonB family protein